MENTLYYDDNLDILKRHISDESVDLVYLGPPFKNNQNYNVLFKEKNGRKRLARSAPSRILGPGARTTKPSMPTW